MFSTSEFEKRLDEMVPIEIIEELHKEIDGNSSMMDLANLVERGRAYVIKRHISSFHKWTRANLTSDDGNIVECFWCEGCNIRCSVFDHVRCLSIISRVQDNRPTYTVHNKYLTLTCHEVLQLSANSKKCCFKCGAPEKAHTQECELSARYENV